MFVKWTHCIYLNEGDWWSYEIKGGASWYWKRLVSLKNSLREKTQLANFVATPYTIKRGCDMMNEQIHDVKVTWDKIVWERMTLPKHRFIMWLAMLGKLRTKDVLWRIGVVNDQQCLLCNAQTEQIQHLFFECTYSKACLTGIKEWLGWKSNAQCLEKLTKQISKIKQRSVKKKIFAVVLSSTVYNIWRVRNDVLWNAKVWLV